jgi:ribosomal protein S18 acetylase RimI-like enzyme
MQEIKTYDATYIAGLEMELFPSNALSWKTIESEITHGEGFVVYEDDFLIGYLLARTSGGLTDILRLGVRSRYQRCLWGTRLLQALLQSRVGQPVMLTVRKNNPAMHFYCRHGFKIAGQLATAESAEESWVLLHANGAVVVPAGTAV